MSKGGDFYRKETETEKETNGFHLSFFLVDRRTRKVSGKINRGGRKFSGEKDTRRWKSTREVMYDTSCVLEVKEETK